MNLYWKSTFGESPHLYYNQSTKRNQNTEIPFQNIKHKNYDLDIKFTIHIMNLFYSNGFPKLVRQDWSICPVNYFNLSNYKPWSERLAATL